EEGYLRPHWMTLELEGVNAHSQLKRNKDWVVDQAKSVAVEPELPPITASFRRRVRDATRHYAAVALGRFAYPHYRSHRPGWALVAALGWTWKFFTGRYRAAQAERIVEQVKRHRFFLMPLQLSGDYQIRAHSPFPDMPGAAAYVLESFASHAPADAHLLMKAHPLDSSFFDWAGFIRGRAAKLGMAERVHYIDGGDLDELAAQAAGMVCVNSTSATLALQAGTSVCALGEAIYKFPGLTFSGHVDEFWSNPTPPDPGLYEAFRRVLVDQCLVRGGLASESAVTTLVENLAEKLCAGSVAHSVASQAVMLKK
ncbi:MAG TPA: capsular biosynthesis protein, partial [Sphingomicrobium sp.]|nr:capsular biosynthesis protein [Sphingomicrobium sp.]